jgi:hypothetical protein
MTETARQTEIFSTTYGKVSQCDKRHCFIIEFEGKETEVNVPCFFCLKRMVDRVDLHAMASNVDSSADVEIVAPHGCNHCFALTISQVMQLKELLAGARVMLELNSIVHERLYKPYF